MKKLNFFAGIVSILILLVGCSGDPENIIVESPQKAQLSFGAILNNLDAVHEAIKQETGENPECSDDLPAFAEVVVTRNNSPIAGTRERPLRIKINQDAVDISANGLKKYLSQKVAALELEAGNYTLEHFSVLNSAGEVIYSAPSIYSDNINSTLTMNRPLPYRFSLAPGINKHLDLDVICLNEQLVITTEEFVALEFCIFGSYCDEDGRHAEATRIIASIWEYSGEEEEPRGTLLYENVENGIIIVDNFEEEYSETITEPLCFSLPDTSEMDQFYIEVTIGSGMGYDGEERVIRRGVITEDDIRSLFDGEDKLDYYHIREGNCNMEDSPQLLEIVVADESN